MTLFKKIIFNPKMVVEANLNQLLPLILKLAKIEGFNDVGEIKNDEGNFIPGTSVIDLIKASLSDAPVETVNESFIKLLIKAGVNPSQVKNITIKERLTHTHKNTPSVSKVKPENKIKRKKIKQEKKIRRKIKKKKPLKVTKQILDWVSCSESDG